MKNCLTIPIVMLACSSMASSPPALPPVIIQIGTQSGNDSIESIPATNDYCQTIGFALGVPVAFQFSDASKCCYECWFGNSPNSTVYHKIFTNAFPNFYDGTNWNLLQQVYDHNYSCCPITVDTRRYWWFEFRAFTNYVNPMTSTNYCTNRIYQKDIYSYFAGDYYTSNLQTACWRDGENFVRAGWGVSNVTYQISDTQRTFTNTFVGTNGIWMNSQPINFKAKENLFNITNKLANGLAK